MFAALFCAAVWTAVAEGAERLEAVRLARELAEDGCPTLAARECRRVVSGDPADREAAALLRTLAAAESMASVDRQRPRGAWLAEGIVGVYRRWIRPAIGRRCSLSPSCSEYFLQAARRHGWLAFPMIADRLVREPGVVAAGAAGPDGRVADPLEEHDVWLGRSRR
ncbi:MAG: membrane protein insertion efficiency factor YidD [Kiritimatiellae bacterium]|nr:membrane protein insertion efficiency factor YidD [Kiritimatiellia bacterium]